MPSDANWVEAKRQAIDCLAARARERDTITYKQFVGRIKAIPGLNYHGDPRLDQLLDEISLEEESAGRGLISVLVVEAALPNLPSDGFFELAGPRHPDGTSRRDIFEHESERVWDAHAETT